MFKRLLPLMLLCACAFAQNAQVTLPALPDAPNPSKEHNFFLNGWNTPLLAAGGGGAILAAKEWNGVLHYYIPDRHEWSSQLGQSYKGNLAIFAGYSGIAYGFHKASFKHHHLVERIALIAGAGGLYWNGVRNKHAYDKTDCDLGHENNIPSLIQKYCH